MHGGSQLLDLCGDALKRDMLAETEGVGVAGAVSVRTLHRTELIYTISFHLLAHEDRDRFQGKDLLRRELGAFKAPNDRLCCAIHEAVELGWP